MGQTQPVAPLEGAASPREDENASEHIEVNLEPGLEARQVIALAIHDDLASAMARVLARVNAVRKDANNDYHGYAYTSEAGFVNEVRGLIGEEGIGFFPTVADYSTEVLESGKRKEYRTIVKIDITWSYKGEDRVTTWYGQGTDTGDKSFYKAYTGAIKYAIWKTFLIASQDDPERDEHLVAQQREEAAKARRALDERLHDLAYGGSENLETYRAKVVEYHAWFANKLGEESFEDIDNADRLQRAIGWLSVEDDEARELLK